jgi:hypothetical protein
MVVLRDVAHAHTDLAVIHLARVAAPLTLDAYRVRAAFGETAGIESDDAIGLAQSIGHLTNQHLEQELRSGSYLLQCGQDCLRTLEDETPLELPPGATLSKTLAFHHQVGDET